MAAPKTTTPSVIRAALRGEVLSLIPEIVDIVLDDDVKAGDRVRAFEAIVRYGLGVADQAAVHVHAEGNAQVGVVVMPGLGDEVPPEEIEVLTPQQLAPPEEG